MGAVLAFTHRLETIVCGNCGVDFAMPEQLMDKKGVWRQLQAIRAAANKPTPPAKKVRDPIPHFSLHDLRRAWASHMLDAGHKIEKISQWLGHADMITTLRYLRVIDSDMPKPETLPW